MTMVPPITTAVPTMTIKKKQPLSFRHEEKHLIHSQDDFLLTQRLQKLFSHDPHAESHGVYRVTSLYFDTPYDDALRQKINGVNRREKFRLRYYGEDTGFLRLEKKIKENGLCGKLSARLTLDQAELLLRGEIQFLLSKDSPLLLELYSKMQGQLLRPKTIVCYDREAFLYAPGNVRITIDRNLRTSTSCRDFLIPSRMPVPVSDGCSVLEVKYDEFLPEIVRLAVQTPNRRASAYSKYAVCRRYD